MLTVLFLCLFRFTCGFLLGNGTSSIPVKQTYLTKTEYFTDQDQIKQKITLQSNELMNKASHSELNLLASQIQSKLDAFEQKLLTQASTGTSQTSGAELEHKYQALEQKLTTLEQKNKLLEQTLATKELEMVELRHNQSLEMAELRQNQTLEMAEFKHNLALEMSNLQQKIVNLEHLKSINQTQTLDNLDQKTQTLVTKVNALENTVQARSQDFVALYNEVKQQTTTMKELENTTKQQTTAMQKLENTTKQQTTAMEKLENTTKQQTAAMEKLENTTKQQTTAMEKLGNRTQRDLNLNQRLQNESLNHLQQYIDGQLQPVILTACNESGTAYPVEQYSPLLFPNILTSVGVPDQAHFQQTGRFRCSSPGYYYVTTTMESDTVTFIAIVVNSTMKHRQHVTSRTDGALTSDTTDITLHLTTGDEVWITHDASRRRYFFHSCFTIFKIK